MSYKEVALIAGALAEMGVLFENPKAKAPRMLRGRQRQSNPWDRVHLSKAERKGKTYEEVQSLRFQKWERQCNKRLQQDKKPPSEVMVVKLK